jgi:hypothetical protein
MQLSDVQFLFAMGCVVFIGMALGLPVDHLGLARRSAQGLKR